SAKGIQEAKEKLDTFKLSPKERSQYNYYLKRLMDTASEHHTRMADLEDLLKKKEKETRNEEKINAILGFHRNGVSVGIIALSLSISEEFVRQVIQEHT
ncbi:MAG: hypothetical protein AB8E82_09480, partial [Aureispira sp.]